MNSNLIEIAYLIAAVLFIVGIKGMTKPKTAVLGNQLSAVGMLVAVVVTLLDRNIITFEWIIAGIAVGTVIGLLLALKIRMTAMPQLVALLNGFGGAASVGVAIAEYKKTLHVLTQQPTSLLDAAQQLLEAATMQGGAMGVVAMSATGLTILVGAVTFTGSMVAYGKLQEILPGRSIGFPGMQLFNAVLAIGSLLAIVWLVREPTAEYMLWLLLAASLLLGVLLVIPIGGADMPVVISLLNAYSGIAASAAGFVMNNNALIITGSLVGASGIILTQIMCKAMNRSLVNVLFGKMAAGSEAINADDVYQGKVKSTSPDEVGMLLESARRVVIVPGFGMAMSQAQHAVRDLTDAMEKRGTVVEFGIHPVAGRMPGHMNVLLAEAEIPYDKLLDMDTVNPTFEQTDVVIVIGANDVVNPMAREDKGSPIYGMPILNVDKAKTVIVVKRSLGSGFAGLPNPLFAKDNTLMLYGDGKKAILDVIAALKEL